MKFIVAVTDNEWFRYLRQRKPEEVNFWSPGRAPIRADVGTPWLFKLHAPLNFVVGGGYFMHRTVLPLRVAWDTFAEQNGAANYDAFAGRIQRLSGRAQPPEVIGCTVLSEPFFWDESQWLAPPPNWAPNNVSREGYDTAGDHNTAAYWSRVVALLPRPTVVSPDTRPAQGAPTTYFPRLGQGGFRSIVIDAYARRCAVTGERTLPALEAAHILPFSEVRAHDVRNGLLLRADLHKLLDDGYVTVTGRYEFEVSRRIRDEFENGRDYYALHGKQIALPADPRLAPDPALLDAHASRIYRG